MRPRLRMTVVGFTLLAGGVAVGAAVAASSTADASNTHHMEAMHDRHCTDGQQITDDMTHATHASHHPGSEP